MKIKLLIKYLIISFCIMSIPACFTKTQIISKEKKTGVVNFAIVDFYDNDSSYKLTINNKTIVDEIPKMEMPEVGLNTTVMKPITFGENFISLYKNGDIIYQDKIVIPENTKIIYVSPHDPYILLSEGTTLLLD